MDWAALAVGILAVAVRVAAAWAGRILTNPDSSVVGLMASHIAAGREFPVFFYGQAYMGSLEPAVSALMIRLLGLHGFAVNLGPVVLSLIFLYGVWRWAREAAGPEGGLAAMLAVWCGPPVVFQFQTAARGGYVVALVVETCVLLASARIAAAYWQGRPVVPWRFLLLGFLAGLGMWSHMIVAASLIAAGLMVCAGMRGRFWTHPKEIAAGSAGFLLGFSPWLVWNLRHGWASLARGQFGPRAALADSLGNSWTRFLWLQDAGIPGLSPVWYAAGILALVALGCWVIGRGCRTAPPQENFARAAAMVFTLGFAAMYVLAGLNTTRTARYWVPIMPGLALLIACACALPPKRLWRTPAWTVLLLLVVGQGRLAFATIKMQARVAPAHQSAFQEIGAVLQRANVEALLAPIQLYPLNYALQEQWAVSPGRPIFYPPIFCRAELAADPAYTSDFQGIETFLKIHNTHCDFAPAGGRKILWNVRRPPRALEELPPPAVTEIRDSSGNNWQAVLTDRNWATAWSPAGAQPPSDPFLQWSFTAPETLAGLRLVFGHAMDDPATSFPRRAQIEIQVEGVWHTLHQPFPLIPLEWSGPRLYTPQGPARLEWPLTVENVEALRIHFIDLPADRAPWRLVEAQLFRPAPAPPPPENLAALDALGRHIQMEYPEVMIYAPRWVSNQLLAREWVNSSHLAGLNDKAFPPALVPRDGSLPDARPWLLVVDARLAPAAREVFRREKIGVRDQASGPWQLFYLAPRKKGGADRSGKWPIRWIGDTVLATTD